MDTTQNTGGTRTVTIKPGEKYVLPAGAVVKSVVVDGAITVDSTCNNLPTPTAYACGYFYLILDQDSNDGHSMDELNTYYTSLKVGATIFTLGERVIFSGNNPGAPANAATLNNHITDPALFKVTAVSQDALSGSSKRQAIWVYFKTPSDVMNQIELVVDNRGSLQYYKPYLGTCGEYPFGSVIS
jgi:hypothetical protein